MQPGDGAHDGIAGVGEGQAYAGLIDAGCRLETVRHDTHGVTRNQLHVREDERCERHAGCGKRGWQPEVLPLDDACIAAIAASEA